MFVDLFFIAHSREMTFDVIRRAGARVQGNICLQTFLESKLTFNELICSDLILWNTHMLNNWSKCLYSHHLRTKIMHLYSLSHCLSMKSSSHQGSLWGKLLVLLIHILSILFLDFYLFPDNNISASTLKLFVYLKYFQIIFIFYFSFISINRNNYNNFRVFIL